MATLSVEQAREQLADVAGWEVNGTTIRRQFSFEGFPEALAFVMRLGFAAEAADHHPDIFINYRRVTLTYTTHSEGALTEKDVMGAREATGIAAAAGAGPS